VLTEFDFDGLIPYGVYTLWNVLETQPFKDEPYAEFGTGKHSIVADGQGRAHKMVARDSWSFCLTTRRRKAQPGVGRLSRRAVGQIPCGTGAMKRSRQRAACALISAIWFFASPAPGHAAESEIVHVTLKDHRFEPQLVEVKPGQVIAFDNRDTDLHSVVVLDVLKETFVDPSKSLSVVVSDMTRSGDYLLACTIHADMTATVRVTGP
jgi:plastocyanin